jgi:hypothetical protein
MKYLTIILCVFITNFIQGIIALNYLHILVIAAMDCTNIAATAKFSFEDLEDRRYTAKGFLASALLGSLNIHQPFTEAEHTTIGYSILEVFIYNLQPSSIEVHFTAY